MDEATIEVVPTSGPFQIASPSAGEYAGLAPVMWHVAETDAAPIDNPTVGLELSTDGANSFTRVAQETSNDGNSIVELPNVASSLSRFWIASDYNVFYALSKEHFTIRPYRAAIVVIRHAEETDGADPGLGEAGKARAEALADLLQDARIDRVLVAATTRAQETAAPFASRVGLKLETFDTAERVAQEVVLARDPAKYLVVADADTIPAIIRALGASEIPPIRDSEYDRLFILSQTDGPAILRPFLYAQERLVELSNP